MFYQQLNFSLCIGGQKAPQPIVIFIFFWGGHPSLKIWVVLGMGGWSSLDPLQSQAPTPVEIELGCDNYFNILLLVSDLLKDHSFLEIFLILKINIWEAG